MRRYLIFVLPKMVTGSVLGFSTNFAASDMQPPSEMKKERCCIQLAKYKDISCRSLQLKTLLNT
jgi:hypothetical protein